jgi:hypothetical protein
MACDTIDELCYSYNDDNDDCDERGLERIPAGIIVVKIVGYSSPRLGSFTDRRRS